MKTRAAEDKDVPEMLAIFNHEVRNGASVYDDVEQTLEERHRWFRNLRDGDYPVVAAEDEGRLAGFAALVPFHVRRGYRYTVVASIYVADGYRRRGVGRALCEALLAAARARGYHSIIGGISAENTASLKLVQSFGAEQAGYFKEIGFKDGRWIDEICWQIKL